MYLKALIVIAVTFIVSIGCSRPDSARAQADDQSQTAKKTQAVSQAEAPATKKQSPKVIKRGSALPQGDYLSLDQIIKDPESFANRSVLVTGQVSAVCQAKGCWMSIKSGSSNASARVTFKDYAFFVPKDSKGMRGKMKGVVQVKMLSEGERKHLAEDGRVDVSEIPKAELRIQAEGLELYPQG